MDTLLSVGEAFNWAKADGGTSSSKAMKHSANGSLLSEPLNVLLVARATFKLATFTFASDKTDKTSEIAPDQVR